MTFIECWRTAHGYRNGDRDLASDTRDLMNQGSPSPFESPRVVFWRGVMRSHGEFYLCDTRNRNVDAIRRYASRELERLGLTYEDYSLSAAEILDTRF